MPSTVEPQRDSRPASVRPAVGCVVSEPERCSWNEILVRFLDGEDRPVFYYIAVGQRAEDFVPKPSPPAAFASGNSQFDRGFAAWMTEHASGYKEPVAEGV